MTPPQSAAPAPAVSVIIVNYNAGPLLAECVAAVLSSSLRVEVIVSDNGSVDDSLERLKAARSQEPRLSVLENGANLGFARANNRALPLAHADYLLFLNPDCLIGPETLARIAGFMDRRPDVGMAGCLILNPDGSEQVACRRSIPDPWIAFKRLTRLDRLTPGAGGRRLNHDREPLPTSPTDVEAISGSFMFVRRRALDAVGPLDEGYFLHCEDLDWFVRFHRTGWKIALIPDVSVIHHKGACSTSDPIAVERHKHRGMERFFRKFQAHRYPRPFSALVILGIRLHFFLIRFAAYVRSLARGIFKGSR
ncbi:dTDP-Rha--alpha-D-GlcNAc-pyrophosphate polyprenol alpha-3-L-rhamnosyltransferase [Thiocystis minor]|uniref:glycosyltransferase family 2 protein n=1 Tax=Thiocystis minor TaxID=61597 RepID=UPI0019130C10|nr:glycosyltransferase family 2 protein [Thiocystis minor]MBK5966054.1 dTDP-Rha--alpha-D-GlcNAc-pyrophosphate polyprenol alpha-3-L-rhamnosyltransferase [Thiocystis minor]